MPETWNVIPDGFDPMMQKTFPASETTFETVVYRRYTPAGANRTRDRRNAQATNTGSRGPLLHARVGDQIVVHFKNLDTL